MPVIFALTCLGLAIVFWPEPTEGATRDPRRLALCLLLLILGIILWGMNTHVFSAR